MPGTAFEILSIDIADVDVGKNIGAELQTDQAEADKRIAQAKAEERRALAVAMEQEFKAEAQNQRAKVIAAEAQIPLAIAEAFRSGNLGVMDYQRYRNVQADTTMRQAIAGQSRRRKYWSTGQRMTGEINGFLVIGALWFVLTLITRAKGSIRPRQPGPPSYPRPTPLPSRPDPTQQEGIRLQRVLGDLRRALEEAAQAGSPSGEPMARPRQAESESAGDVRSPEPGRGGGAGASGPGRRGRRYRGSTDSGRRRPERRQKVRSEAAGRAGPAGAGRSHQCSPLQRAAAPRRGGVAGDSGPAASA